MKTWNPEYTHCNAELHRETDEMEVSEDEDLQTGSIECPDDQNDKIVRLPLLLGAGLANHLEVDLERLEAVPLIRRLNDDWRSREITDLSIIVLRILVLRQILHVDKISISDLYPGLKDSQFADRIVKVPKTGFRVQSKGKQLSAQQFAELLNDPDRADFAFIGPGNKGADSWIFLEFADDCPHRYLIIQFESKSRQGPENISQEKVKAEFRKMESNENCSTKRQCVNQFVCHRSAPSGSGRNCDQEKEKQMTLFFRTVSMPRSTLLPHSSKPAYLPETGRGQSIGRFEVYMLLLQRDCWKHASETKSLVFWTSQVGIAQ